MIDMQAENLLPLAEAVKRTTGRRISIQTVARWCKRGLKSAGNRRIKMESVMFGGRRMTTCEAVARFIFERSQADVPPAPQRYVSPASQARETKRDIRELEKLLKR